MFIELRERSIELIILHLKVAEAFRLHLFEGPSPLEVSCINTFSGCRELSARKTLELLVNLSHGPSHGADLWLFPLPRIYWMSSPSTWDTILPRQYERS